MSAPPSSPSRMPAALALARSGLGTTGTNPSVGCVIEKDGRVLGRGRTAAGGRPHAETEALAQAARRHGPEACRGGTAWVTLEPCAHRGRTPPCTDALVAAGIARVVAPFEDPDPRVSGKGFAALRAAGVAVETGAMAAEAASLLRGYLSRAERGRPWLTLKLAAGLDGRIAAPSGESRWITGPASRRRVHLMRARADAVLVGIGSVLADDPSLDVRLEGLEGRRAWRVVADGRLQTPLTGRLARSAAEHPTLLLTRDDAPPERAAAFADCGVRVLALPADAEGRVPLRAALEALAGEGIGEVLCEGGGRLAAGLLREGLVDELAWFSAGLVTGGRGAASVADLGIEALAEAPRFERVSVEPVGEDVLSLWRPAPSPE